MHGRPRKAPTQEEQEASSLKAGKLRELQSQLLHFHHNKIYTKEAVDISTKLLESNPEHNTGWNYRKLAVQNLLGAAQDSDTIQSILDDELRLVEKALRVNFKSYGAWYHRKWILSKGHSSTDRELGLLGKFQKLDARNFHAWNYRRFITGLKEIPDEKELQFTTDMIYDNFSNYSAWHNRSMLLSRLLEARAEGYSGKENVFGEEFEFVRNALFTDPDDQSGWFYHSWLLDQTVKREPLLISSWPLTGSNLQLSIDGYVDGQSLYPVLPYQSRTYPIILCFNEAVQGVSSSTVTVECEYHAGDDLIWTPLSSNKLGLAQSWLTYISFPDEMNSLKQYSVKVAIAQFPGITSLSGAPCSTSCVSFTVCVPHDDREHTEVQSMDRRVSWKEENYRARVSEPQDVNLLHSLSNLNLNSTIDDKPTASEWSMETISNEIAHCRELLSSTNCKIGKLILARLLMAQKTLISYKPNDGASNYYDEILALYRDLMKMDPKHLCYYEDEYSLAFLKQLTSNMESLLKHSYEYQEFPSPNMKSTLCVRLNGLSLSRVGSMECLLWVQMLDLSHNKLRSVEGLEALQLLSSLNLSNNNICSFTALEPIRMLKSLQALDISYNEIGAHSVDTSRYLCSSPMNHALGNNWNFDEFANGDKKSSDHWDAFLVFKDLNLIQLEVTENPAANDKLKSFLFKIMPRLKWLDGVSRS